MNQTLEKTSLLDCIIEAFHTVIQLPKDVLPHTTFVTLAEQKEIGVLISMTGELSPRLLIVGEHHTFEKLGVMMFGMSMEGETLLSFVGEIGNMIAGNACSVLSKQGVIIDITAPTVMTGHYTMTGFNHGIAVPIQVNDVGQITIYILLRE